MILVTGYFTFVYRSLAGEGERRRRFARSRRLSRGTSSSLGRCAVDGYLHSGQQGQRVVELCVDRIGNILCTADREADVLRFEGLEIRR